jgi:hypothetical protein
MEPLPDLAELPDDDLRALIRNLQRQEHQTSYERKILQGKIDILRAELSGRRGGGALDESDGVREPRRPSPAAGGAAAAVDDETS